MTDLLGNILDYMIEPLAFDTAGIYMYDPETKKVNLMARRGAPSQFYLIDKYMAIDSMPFSQVLGRGQPVYVEHLRGALPDLEKKWKWQMACCIPLVSKGIVVGAMNMASRRRSIFSSNEKNILELIGKEIRTSICSCNRNSAAQKRKIPPHPDRYFPRYYHRRGPEGKAGS